jgi:hypothetical protein
VFTEHLYDTGYIETGVRVGITETNEWKYCCADSSSVGQQNAYSSWLAKVLDEYEQDGSNLNLV